MSSVPPPPASSPPTSGPTSSTTTTTTTGPPASPPPPPPPPPLTSSTTTTTTSLSTTSTTDAASTSSSILTSSTTTPILTITSTTPLPTSTTLITTSATGGAVTTIVSIVTTTSSRSGLAAPTGTLGSSTSGNKGFFHNTGAVAGVFTVVGLIVLAIIIALITNCIRRRRAQKFDDEIAAAARDAANAQVPNFGYEDEDDEYRHGGYGAGGVGAAGAAGAIGSKYSDMSHGTYAQPPMSVPESYGMRELPHQGLGPNPGEYFDPSSNAYGAAGAAAAAGAAGVGVARARSMRDGGYAAGLTEGSSPYAAFAAAPPGVGKKPSIGHVNGPQYPPGMIRGAGSPEFDLHRRPSQYAQQQQLPTDHPTLARNKSQVTTNSGSAPSYHSDPSSNGGYNGYPNSYGAYATSTPPGVAPVPVASGKHLQPIPSSRSEENLDDAYGGYVDEDEPHHSGYSAQLPNPFSPTAAASHPPAGRSGRDYGDDSEDEIEEPRRVLKVANE